MYEALLVVSLAQVSLAFCVKTVHHGADKLQLVLQTEVDEVGINKDAVWGYQGGVVRQEQGGGNLRPVPSGWAVDVR